jgi:hypothetical protein
MVEAKPMSPQCSRLLTYLQEQGPINPMQAWERLGIYRLGARVFDLREAGHKIDRDLVEVSNRFGELCRVARYELKGECDEAIHHN